MDGNVAICTSGSDVTPVNKIDISPRHTWASLATGSVMPGDDCKSLQNAGMLFASCHAGLGLATAIGVSELTAGGCRCSEYPTLGDYL